MTPFSLALANHIPKRSTILIHAGWNYLKRRMFITPDHFFTELKQFSGEEISIIIPAFTYCYQRTDNAHRIFDPLNSPSEVGYVSEYFRTMPEVKRTTSPTHSFCIYGPFVQFISEETTSPASPLGNKSILSAFEKQTNPLILFAGTGLTACTYIHYLENKFNLPYITTNPFEPFGYLSKGMAQNGETDLIEIPGCSNGFRYFEAYLRANELLHEIVPGCLVFSPNDIENYLRQFLFADKYRLLCPQGDCKYCDTRRVAQ